MKQRVLVLVNLCSVEFQFLFGNTLRLTVKTLVVSLMAVLVCERG